MSNQDIRDYLASNLRQIDETTFTEDKGQTFRVEGFCDKPSDTHTGFVQIKDGDNSLQGMLKEGRRLGTWSMTNNQGLFNLEYSDNGEEIKEHSFKKAYIDPETQERRFCAIEAD